MIEQYIFGKCKVCINNDAVFSSMVCKECHVKKNKVVQELYLKGLEPGTEEFIQELKQSNVYY